MRRRTLFSLALAAGAKIAAGASGAPLKLRSRVELFKGGGAWKAIELSEPLEVKQTAIIICDMWDKHWCRGANERVAGLVSRMEPFLQKMRGKGMLVIHAPSDTMDFYKDARQRSAILSVPRIAPPQALALSDPPLPVDSSDGGCDTDDTMYKAWKRQHAGLTIGENDLISDKGEEIYAALKNRGIDTLLVMGVHTNMCILNRTFAIRQMTKWGMKCILVRDLTDAMYDPKDKPFVAHDAGTELVVEHIEKYWAPSTLSSDVLRSVGAR